MDPRCLQLDASMARTIVTGAVGKGHVATLIADKPSVHLWHHGPELDAENAIGTTNNFLGHNKVFSQTARAKRLRSVKNVSPQAFAARCQ
jgi:hypothetical protein